MGSLLNSKRFPVFLSWCPQARVHWPWRIWVKASTGWGLLLLAVDRRRDRPFSSMSPPPPPPPPPTLLSLLTPNLLLLPTARPTRTPLNWESAKEQFSIILSLISYPSYIHVWLYNNCVYGCLIMNSIVWSPDTDKGGKLAELSATRSLLLHHKQ